MLPSSTPGLGSAGENARGAAAQGTGDCVFDDTVETTVATGYPGFDSYELGFDDNNGYNDEGELDELVGVPEATTCATSTASTRP